MHLKNRRWVDHTAVTFAKATSTCGDRLLAHLKAVSGHRTINGRAVKVSPDTVNPLGFGLPRLFAQKIRYRHLGSLRLRHSPRRRFGEGRLPTGRDAFRFKGALAWRSTGLSGIVALWELRSMFLLTFFWVISPSLSNCFVLPTCWRSSAALISCQRALAIQMHQHGFRGSL